MISKNTDISDFVRVNRGILSLKEIQHEVEGHEADVDSLNLHCNSISYMDVGVLARFRSLSRLNLSGNDVHLHIYFLYFE
jgi:Leucine-rich repeat (LRR) protein